MIALIMAALLLMAPLPIVPTVDPIEAAPQATKTTTSSAKTILEQISKAAGEYQEKAQSLTSDLTSYNSKVKAPNQDVIAVSQGYGSSESTVSKDFDIKNPQKIMASLDKLFLLYPCSEQRCEEIYDKNKYEFYENNVVEIYALTNTIDKLIDERLTPLLDDINIQAVSDEDQNQNIRNNLMVRQAVVQILTIIHELSAAELQLDTAIKIKEMDPVHAGEEIIKSSYNMNSNKINFASIENNEDMSFAFAESYSRSGFEQFDKKASFESEDLSFGRNERLVKEEPKYKETLGELRSHKKLNKDEVEINTSKDLKIDYIKQKSTNVKSKEDSVKISKSVGNRISGVKIEDKELIDFGADSMFGYPKKLEKKHPVSLIKDELLALADVEPLREKMDHLIMVQNKLNEIYDYPARLDRFRETRIRHANILNALAKSDSAIVAYFNRHANGVGKKVWYGSDVAPKTVNDYDSRGGLSAKAMAIFDAQKAIIADENPESAFEVPSTNLEDMKQMQEENDQLKAYDLNDVYIGRVNDEDQVVDAKTGSVWGTVDGDDVVNVLGIKIGRVSKEVEVSSADNIDSFVGENADLLEDEDLAAMQEDNRKTQLIAWNTGRFLMQDVYQNPASYNISSLDPLPVWNDNKNFYDAYIMAKFAAIQKYINKLGLPVQLKVICDAAIVKSRNDYNNLSDNKYYPSGHSEVVSIFDNLQTLMTGGINKLVNAEKSTQSDLKSKNNNFNDEISGFKSKIAELEKKLSDDKALADGHEDKMTEDEIKQVNADIEAENKNIEDRNEKISVNDGLITESESKQAVLESKIEKFMRTKSNYDNDYIVSASGSKSDLDKPAKEPRVELNIRQLLYFDDIDFNNLTSRENDEVAPLTLDGFLDYKYGDIDDPNDGTDSYLPEIWYYMLKMKKGDYNFSSFDNLINKGKKEAYEETIHMIANAENADKCFDKYTYNTSNGENNFSELGIFISNHTRDYWSDIFAADPDDCNDECIQNNFRYAYSRNEIGDFLNIRSAEIGYNAAVKKANADIKDINDNFIDLLKLAEYSVPKDFDVMKTKEKSGTKYTYIDLELARTKLTEYRDKLISVFKVELEKSQAKASGNDMLKERLEPIASVLRMLQLDKKAYLRVSESTADIPNLEEQIKTAEADMLLQEKYNEEANASFKNDVITVFCPVY